MEVIRVLKLRGSEFAYQCNLTDCVKLSKSEGAIPAVVLEANWVRIYRDKTGALMVEPCKCPNDVARLRKIKWSLSEEEFKRYRPLLLDATTADQASSERYRCLDKGYNDDWGKTFDLFGLPKQANFAARVARLHALLLEMLPPDALKGSPEVVEGPNQDRYIVRVDSPEWQMVQIQSLQALANDPDKLKIIRDHMAG